jgi:hypothetical protein
MRRRPTRPGGAALDRAARREAEMPRNPAQGLGFLLGLWLSFWLLIPLVSHF